MTRFSKILLALSVVTAFSAVTQTKSEASPLDIYLWQARPVLVFGQGAAYDEQIAKFKQDASQLNNRDMVVIGISGNNVTMIVGRPSLQASANAMRHAYHIKGNRFEVVLVGKDGGVKSTSRNVISPHSLFKTVDAMPMRRNEMMR